MMQINGTPQTEFKETEIGLIPVDWTSSNLQDFIKQHSAKNKSKLDLPVYTVSNIFGFVLSDDFFDHQVYSRDLGTYKIVETSYFAYNPYRINVGSIGLLNSERGLVSPAYVVFSNIRPEQLDNQFLFLLIKSDLITPQIQSFADSRGSVRKTLSFKDLSNIFIPLPPITEQRRIATVLSTIQDEIAVQDNILGELREFKRSTMERLFTYGAGDTPAETKPSRFGDVPSHWDIFPLEDYAFVQTGTAKGKRFKESDIVITVPYLRVANVQDGYLDLDEIKYIKIKQSELDRYLLHAGDVLMTEGGDFDKLGRGFVWNGEIEPCIHQNHVFAIRVNHDLLIPEFLAYLGQSTYGKSYFLTVAHKTTNLASINTTKLKALPVLLAPKSEQIEIVKALQTIDEKIAVEEDCKSVLEDFFRTMLQQLMTGQVRLLSDDGLEGFLDGKG